MLMGMTSPLCVCVWQNQRNNAEYDRSGRGGSRKGSGNGSQFAIMALPLACKARGSVITAYGRGRGRGRGEKAEGLISGANLLLTPSSADWPGLIDEACFGWRTGTKKNIPAHHVFFSRLQSAAVSAVHWGVSETDRSDTVTSSTCTARVLYVLYAT